MVAIGASTFFALLLFSPSSEELVSLSQSDAGSWTRQEVGNTGITAQLPQATASPFKSEKVDQAAQSLQQFDAHTVRIGEVSIVFQRATMAPTRPTSAKAIMEATIQRLQEGDAFADLRLESVPIAISGKNGFKIQGSGLRADSEVGITILILVEGNRLWQVSSVYDARIAEQVATVKRVIDSVQIRG
jgi:hypothetical protein